MQFKLGGYTGQIYKVMLGGSHLEVQGSVPTVVAGDSDAVVIKTWSPSLVLDH